MTPLYTANHIESIPVNLDVFFGSSRSHKCTEWSMEKDKEGQLVLRLDDYGENPSLFTIEEVASTKYGDIYHSHHYYYFLVVEDVDENDEDISYVIVTSVV